MSSSLKDRKQALVAAASVMVIAASTTWIYLHHFRGPGVNEVLHIGVGQVMAQETARLLGNHGKIMIVTIDPKKFPELKVQMETFHKTLKSLGKFSVERTFTLDTEDKQKYRTGAGLSGRRFLRIVAKSSTADAIVSFVGAPDLSSEETATVTKWPKFIAETRSPEKLKNLFEKKVIQAAVVSRFDFPSPGTVKPKTPSEWFTNRFQVITNAASLP
jgi:hypothetical protein